jgi:nickel-dependent lactate racemase
MTPEELKERVGNKVFENYKVLNSEFRDPSGLVYVGDTPEGVKIMASKAVIETDIHIGIGCLFPHPVMGWGGGGKILFPGIAGEETVAYFHLKASLFEKNYFGCPTTPVRDMMETWVTR